MTQIVSYNFSQQKLTNHLLQMIDRLANEEGLKDQLPILCRALITVSDYPTRVKLHASKKLIETKDSQNVAIALSTLQETFEKENNSVRNLFLCGYYFSLINQIDQAIACYNKSNSIEANAPAHQNLATIYKRQFKSEQAEWHFRKALECDSNHASARYNLLNILAHRADESEFNALIDQGQLSDSQKARLYNILGQYIAYHGRINSALNYYTQASELEPDSLTYLWSKNLTVPIAYRSQKELDGVRDKYVAGLKDLHEKFDSASDEQKSNAANCLLLPTNYEIHYQSENDLQVQIPYGQLIHKIARHNFPGQLKTLKPAHTLSNRKIRIGFVALGLFSSHSNFKTHGAWITEIDKSRFEIFCYDVGRHDDQSTQKIKQSADYFYNNNGSINELQLQILEDKLDIIIYPGISMDPAVHRLACLRLSPVQCTSWGHPVTTGLPTIDYYLSGKLMEPENGQQNYSETLVQLPNLGIYQLKPSLPKFFKPPKEIAGIPRAETILLCSQNTLKMLPKHDFLFAKLALKLPKAQFWFIESKKDDVNAAVRYRLTKAFKKLGLDFEKHSIMFPRLGKSEFCYVNKEADVVLDTCFWSGCNTTYESMLQGTPVVTLPGNTMRGRHSYAILKMMQLDELIANDKEDYVNIVHKLATDTVFRSRILSHIETHKDDAFEDRTALNGFEQFVEGVVAPQ